MKYNRKNNLISLCFWVPIWTTYRNVVIFKDYLKCFSNFGDLFSKKWMKFGPHFSKFVPKKRLVQSYPNMECILLFSSSCLHFKKFSWLFILYNLKYIIPLRLEKKIAIWIMYYYTNSIKMTQCTQILEKHGWQIGNCS